MLLVGFSFGVLAFRSLEFWNPHLRFAPDGEIFSHSEPFSLLGEQPDPESPHACYRTCAHEVHVCTSWRWLTESECRFDPCADACRTSPLHRR